MRFWLVPLLFASGSVPKSDVPYAPDIGGSGPTFTIEQVRHCYPGTFSSIRAVKFRNFRFLKFGKDGRPSGGYTLKNGHFHQDAKFGHESTDFDSIHYLPKSDLSAGDSALVILSWVAAGASSSQGGNAKVFNLSRNRLCVLQEIDWDTRFEADHATDSFDPRTNTLVVRSAHYMPGDARCCVSAMDIVTLRWDGTKFWPATIQTELSGYGKAKGKTLLRRDPGQ